MLNYASFLDKFEYYLLSKHFAVTAWTDIFEHSFLRFLGYQFVPEKCQFEDTPTGTHLAILLRTPHQLAIRDFISDLKRCASGDFSTFRVMALDPTKNSEMFCVCLTVPYAWFEANIEKIFDSVDTILANPFRMNFYRFWDDYARRFGLGLTMLHIEYLVNRKLVDYPYAISAEIWSAIIKKNLAMNENVELRFLAQQVAIDVEHYPGVTLTYQEKAGEIKQMTLSRVDIVTTLRDVSFNHFLNYTNLAREFVVPMGIRQFIEDNYNRSFSVNKEGHYEIELGYHAKKRETLAKFGIKELSSYRPMRDAPERARYYVYSKETYPQMLLALKEIKGETCFGERLQQLMYYIHHKMWEKLDKELIFLVNLPVATGINLDYSDLGMRLFDYAKSTLTEEVQEKILESIAKVFSQLIAENNLANDIQKKLHNVLFEMHLMQMNTLVAEAGSKAEKLILLEKLFLHATHAGLAIESKHYLEELAGLKWNTFNNDVCQQPLAVLIELAHECKQTKEALDWSHGEIARLLAELAQFNANVVKQEASSDTSVTKPPKFRLFR